ncbi:MAG: hypothetical protein HXS48_06150 [Theionarchaea archaeon]|nr:hypothetical protein [Theionarchaea archaeon]
MTKSFRYKSGILKGTVLMCLLIALLPMISAHAPSQIALEYNLDLQTLEVTLVHTVSDPATHYVYKIEIRKNGVVYTTQEFESQPTDSTFSYTFSVPAARGDVLEITAECNLGGSIRGELEIDTGAAEVKVPELWPIHAGFMSVGFLFMAVAIVNVLNKTPKTSWLTVHKVIGGLGTLCMIIGLATGMYMVSASAGGHLRVYHAYVGVLTIVISVAAPVLGYITLKWKGHRPTMRKVHVWCSRIAIVLILVTIVSGLWQAGVL